MLDSLTVPAWIARILGQLAEAEFIELALVILNAEPPLPTPRFARPPAPRSRHLLLNLYQRIDARFFRAEPDAFGQVDMSYRLASVPTLAVVPLRPEHSECRFAAEAIGTVREADLDVLLRFGFNTIRGEILDCARFGVWAYHHGDNREYRDGPAFFWEMYEDNPVSGTTLQVLTDDLDGGRTLYRSFSATDLSSLYRSRNSAYWKSAEFVIRRLTDLHRRGSRYLDALPDYRESVPYEIGMYRAATNGQMIRFLARVLSGVVARKGRKLLGREIWYVAYRRVAAGGELVSGVISAGTTSHSGSFQLMSSPRGRYYADPFVVEHQGRHYVLFEDYDLATGRAVISWTCFDEHGVPAPAQVALRRDYHLSYPFVFRWSGNWYMAPESAENRTIELFRAEEFPVRWALERVLVDNVTAFDPTILEHHGLWWLFANVAVPGGSAADELFLFYADSLLGEWTPHPLNPIVSDVRCARPAGRVFSQGGMLIRPGQDSSRRYGYATVFNHITTLTATQYAETPIHRLEPGWMRGNLATHTFNTDGEYEVVDALRWVFRKH
jgi:hypothetical protein